MKGKNKVVIFFLMLVTITISIFSLVKTVEVESKVKSSEEEIGASSFSIKILPDTISGTVPHEIKFSSLVLNAKSGVKYFWDFGDGETSTEPNPIHTYKEVGSYISTLTVIDSQSRKIIEQVNITVLKNNPPIVEIVVNRVGGNRPVRINFDANCFDVDGEIISYNWEITDPPLLSRQNVHKYNEKNFSRLFIRSGLYEVKLTVIDDGNNSVIKYLKLNILKSRIELLFGSATYSLTMITSASNIIRSIIDKLEKAPNIPSNPLPFDNSTDVDLNVNLSWTCDDPTLFDVIKFDIYFGVTNPPPLIISGHSSTNFELGMQLSNTTYYWKIVAKDKHGKIVTSSIWNFKTL